MVERETPCTQKERHAEKGSLFQKGGGLLKKEDS